MSADAAAEPRPALAEAAARKAEWPGAGSVGQAQLAKQSTNPLNFDVHGFCGRVPKLRPEWKLGSGLSALSD